MYRSTLIVAAGLLAIAAVEFIILGSGALGARSATASGTTPTAIAITAVAPASLTPAPPVTSTTPVPSSAAIASTQPYIIEVPPPGVVDLIRNGQVPGVTLAQLGASLTNVRGAAALGSVSPFRPSAPAAPDGRAAGAPFLGTDSAIALLVRYADLAPEPASTQASYQSLLFGAGAGSMRSYYKENSYNLYDLQGTVANWVNVGHNRNWYSDFDGVPNSLDLCGGGGDDFGCGYDSEHNTQTLIRDAVLAADASVNFAAYAQDGVVRNLMIIHAGQGAEAAPGTCRVCAWSSAWPTASPIVVDGVSIQSAFIAPEYVYTPGDTNIGILTHEYAHLSFGLPDLYDTDYSSGGVGVWSLMSSGSWNNGGVTPAHLDAWSKVQNGWIAPTIVAADGPQVLPAVEGSATVLKLWTNGASANEYFLVENRQRTGFDTYLPGDGLLIWHIDDNVYSNTDDCHPRVLLVPADSGLALPCNLAFGGGSDGNTWPGSLNRTAWNGATIPGSQRYNGGPTGVGLGAISASGSVMTASAFVISAVAFNDDAQSATTISNPPFTDSTNSSPATVEIGEQSPCGSIGKTLWYRYTPSGGSPPSSNQVTVDTLGSDFDTVLAVYVENGASPPGSLALMACNDDQLPNNHSSVTFTAAPGTTYYIQAGGYGGASGNLLLHATLGSPGGAISGTVRTASSAPIAGAYVSVEGDSCCASAYSAIDGTYLIPNITPGSYRVHASATGYAPEYFDNVSGYDDAAEISVTSGSNWVGIDFALAPEAAIAGKITNASGTPIAGAQISVNATVCCGSNGYALADGGGNYRVGGLQSGSHRMAASAPGYAARYFNGTYDFNAATEIQATSGTTTGGIDLQLIAEARISGKITNELGTPIAGASVSAERTTCCGYGGASTDADGNYTVARLPGGQYQIRVSGPYCPVGASPPCVQFATEYYNNTYDSRAAVPVDSTSGATTPNINAALALGASVSGKIVDPLGTPIAGAFVTAGRIACCNAGWATTAADGTYLITDLPPGDEVVSAYFDACGPMSPPCTTYPSWFYGNACEYLKASKVPLTPGAVFSNINITLRPTNPDCFDHAIRVNTLPFIDAHSSAGSTTAPGEPLPCGNGSATQWYQYQYPSQTSPPRSTSVDTVGSSYNSAVAVYREGVSPPGILTLVKCWWDAKGSLVKFTPDVGVRYFFQVGGQNGATGQLTLNVSPDADDDGYTDIEETRLGENPGDYCSIMRADIDNDRSVSILDLTLVAQRFAQSIPPSPSRLNQDGDAVISILDLAKMALVFTQNVSGCV